MGVLDWFLRPFRGRTPEPQAEGTPSGSPSPAGGSAEASKDKTSSAAEAARAAKAARKEKAARKVKAPKPEKVKAEKPAREPKAREAAPPPKDRTVEVLSVEEAERRYQGLFDAKAPAPAVAEPAPVAVPEPVQARPAPRPAPDPAELARRAEAAENRRRARLPQLQALLSRTDALLGVAEPDPRHLRDARRDLIDGWKELGPPPAELAEALSARKDALIAQLDERAKAGFEVLDAERRGNLEKKRAIVEEALALAARGDQKGAGPAMGQLRAKFRAVGPVPREEVAAIDAAFADAEAKLAATRAAARAEKDGARQAALDKLDRLIVDAERLAGARDLEAAAERIKELQATWKTIRVPGPRSETDDRWPRFRAACDAVFARRTAAREESSKATLAVLEGIVVKAEALAEAGVGDPDEAIRDLMTAWKRAGRAPREARDALWERLQRAFEELRSPFADLPTDEKEVGLQFRPFSGLATPEE